ncbi:MULTISPECIES: diiron oxygenase [unclassified Undibacterium]|uniref:diiron oxygenase n=1 Tax=unclassified Undibacterium TaxID=2630295 RepID=UPI003BF57BF6
MSMNQSAESIYTDRLARLVQLSRDRHVFSFTRFDWVDDISEKDWWVSPELLTIHGTAYYEQASEAQRKLLSKWECINLFSLNVTGEQELIAGVAELLHTPMLKEANDYLHHFIDEENQHMWYFAKFCENYGGKIYGNKKIQLTELKLDPRLTILVRFAQIFIFEEVGHYYNLKIALDERVHPFIREINEAHRNDESRHITFGRALLARLADGISNDYAPEVLDKVSRHLRKYVQVTIESLYNPAMYRDAGFASGMTIRSALLADPARQDFHARELLKKVLALLGYTNLLKQETSLEPAYQS